MPLLIDCYNVLHAAMPPSLAGLDERGLCVALSRSRWAGEPAKIICDGAVKPSTAQVSPVGGVELIYAGGGKSADDAIIALIDRDTAPRRLLVVSSDRQIQKAAKRRGARVMGSAQFVRELAAGPSSGGQSSGRPDLSHPLGPEAVAKWLKEFGVENDSGDAPRRKKD